MLELHALQAAELNFREKRLQVGPTGAAGEVLNLKITGLPLAWVRPFVHDLDVSGGMITGQFSVTAEADQLRARAVEPLRIGTLSIVQRGQLLLNKADLSLSAEAVLTPRELQAKISELTLKTPAGDSFTAQATVALPVSPDPAISVTATCDTDLPKLLAPWLPLGHVKATSEADFTLTGAKLELRRLNASVADGRGADLLKAAALRPFTLDLDARRATTVEKGPTDLMRFTLGRIPLDHLPLNQLGAKLGGVVEQGEFVLAADGDKLTVRAASSMKLSGVSLAQGGQPALADLRIEAQPLWKRPAMPRSWLRTGDVSVVTAAGATLLTFKGEASRAAEAGLRGTLTFNVEVPALVHAAAFAGAQAVTQGRASGEIRAAVGTATQLEAADDDQRARGARRRRQTLPVANLSFRAVANGDGHLSVQAPLLLDRGGAALGPEFFNGTDACARRVRSRRQAHGRTRGAGGCHVRAACLPELGRRQGGPAGGGSRGTRRDRRHGRRMVALQRDLGAGCEIGDTRQRVVDDRTHRPG